MLFLQVGYLRNIATTSRLNVKIYDSPDEAISDIPDGAKLLVGGEYQLMSCVIASFHFQFLGVGFGAYIVSLVFVGLV